MLQLISKTDQVKNLMAQGEFKKALAIASKFRMLDKATKTTLQRAWSAVQSPQFYLDIGQDPVKLTQAGLAAIRTLYNLQ